MTSWTNSGRERRHTPARVAAEGKEFLRVRVGEEVRFLQAKPDGLIVATKHPGASIALPEDVKPPLGKPEILAADFFNEGKAQILVYQANTATIWRYKADHFEPAAKHESSCLPVIGNLNGDGKADLALADISPKHARKYKAVAPALSKSALGSDASARGSCGTFSACAWRTCGEGNSPARCTTFTFGRVSRLCGMRFCGGDTGKMVWDKFESSAAALLGRQHESRQRVRFQQRW